MKTINPELSKRLAPYLEDAETEYFFYWNTDKEALPIEWYETQESVKKYIKTLTLEEAIDFLPQSIDKWKDGEYYLNISKWDWVHSVDYHYYEREDQEILIYCDWKTLLEAISKMLEYLLDKWLLWKN